MPRRLVRLVLAPELDLAFPARNVLRFFLRDVEVLQRLLALLRRLLFALRVLLFSHASPLSSGVLAGSVEAAGDVSSLLLGHLEILQRLLTLFPGLLVLLLVLLLAHPAS